MSQTHWFKLPPTNDTWLDSDDQWLSEFVSVKKTEEEEEMADIARAREIWINGSQHYANQIKEQETEEMPEAIWKFAVPLSSKVESLLMPVGAEILHAAMMNGYLCFWARVDVDSEREERKFKVLATGERFISSSNYQLDYIQTVLDQSFVWHLCEVHND